MIAFFPGPTPQPTRPARRRPIAELMMRHIESQQTLLADVCRVLDLAVCDRNRLAAVAAAMAVELEERP